MENLTFYYCLLKKNIVDKVKNFICYCICMCHLDRYIRSKTNRYSQEKESLSCPLFLYGNAEEIFTKTMGREVGVQREAEALGGSTHEQLVFQILMVLNTKRPHQIPTVEVSDGK